MLFHLYSNFYFYINPDTFTISEMQHSLMTFSNVKFVPISLYVKLSSVELSDENSVTIILSLLSPDLKHFILILKLVSLLQIFFKKAMFFW